MQRFIAPPPAENPLVTTLREKMAAVDGARGRAARRAARGRDGRRGRRGLSGLASVRSPRSKRSCRAPPTTRGSRASARRRALRRAPAQLHDDERSRPRRSTRSAARSRAHRGARWTAVSQLGYPRRLDQGPRGTLAADLSYPDTDEGRRQIMVDIDTMLADALRAHGRLVRLRPATPVTAQPYPEFARRTPQRATRRRRSTARAPESFRCRCDRAS